MAQAALIGCGIITGVGAVLNRAKVEAGRTMAVFGAGGIGLNILQGGVLAGARRIIAVDLVPAKLEWARKFGATDLIDASEVDPVAEVLALTDGGVDYSFEVIGLKSAAEQAFAVERAAGGQVRRAVRADRYRDGGGRGVHRNGILGRLGLRRLRQTAGVPDGRRGCPDGTGPVISGPACGTSGRRWPGRAWRPSLPWPGRARRG